MPGPIAVSVKEIFPLAQRWRELNIVSKTSHNMQSHSDIRRTVVLVVRFLRRLLWPKLQSRLQQTERF